MPSMSFDVLQLYSINVHVPHNNRMQPDFGELELPSAADARRYVANTQKNIATRH